MLPDYFVNHVPGLYHASPNASRACFAHPGHQVPLSGNARNAVRK